MIGTPRRSDRTDTKSRPDGAPRPATRLSPNAITVVPAVGLAARGPPGPHDHGLASRPRTTAIASARNERVFKLPGQGDDFPDDPDGNDGKEPLHCPLPGELLDSIRAVAERVDEGGQRHVFTESLSDQHRTPSHIGTEHTAVQCVQA